jgi:hypothetical protein
VPGEPHPPGPGGQRLDLAALAARRALALLPRIARPRFPGTGGERECARLIREQLEAAGLAVSEEQFSFGRPDLSVRRVLGSVGLAGLLGAWLVAEPLPLVSALVVLGLLAASLLLGRIWLAVAPRLRADGPGASRNLIASMPGATPTLYLCAHYDSKSQSLPLVLRLAMGLGLSALLALLAALLAAKAAGPLGPALRLLFGLAAGLALVLTWQGEGNDSPGALDNGAAVALLLGLAPLAAGPSVGFIFFGAEELGLLGSLDFARRHPEARGLQAVNLDGIGLARRLRLLGWRGQVGGRLRQAAGAAGVRLRGAPLWPGLLMDHVALKRAGLDAASLGCAGGASAKIHSAADTPALIEPEGLREAAAVLLALVLEKASGNELRGG